jgi:hypothetical protein
MKIKNKIILSFILIILNINCGGGGCGLEDDRTDSGLIDEVNPSISGGLRLYDSRDYLVEDFKVDGLGFADLDNEDQVHFYLKLISPVEDSQVKLTLGEAFRINGKSFEFIQVKNMEKVGYSLIQGNQEMSWYYQASIPRSNLYTLYFQDQNGEEISYEFNFNDEIFISSDFQPLAIEELREEIEIEINNLEELDFDFATQCYFDESKLPINQENLNLDENILTLNLDGYCRKGNQGFFTNHGVATNRKLTFDFKESISLGDNDKINLSTYSIRNYHLYLENSLFAETLNFPEVELEEDKILGIRVHRVADDQPLYCAGTLYGLENVRSGGENSQNTFVIDERLFLEENIPSDTEVVLYLVKAADPKYVCYVGEDNQGGYLFDNFFEVITQSENTKIMDLLGDEIIFGDPEVLIQFKDTSI